MKTLALIVAAGLGSRAGGEIPKQYRSVGGRSVLDRTVSAFAGCPLIDKVCIVINTDDEDLCRTRVARHEKLLEPVAGGETRQISVANGLEAVAVLKPERVLIHDAARPFVSRNTIKRVAEALDIHTGAVAALPVTDTVKRTNGAMIENTLPRDRLWTAQTPQGFRFDAILDAHRQAREHRNNSFTDDAAVAEWAGFEMAVVEGNRENMKITTPSDLEFARTVQARQVQDMETRTGNGFDVHAFEPGDHVVLCGVHIPHEASLAGHSDADAALHALTDAILGAIGEGDIGQIFPPGGDQWKDASSDIFLVDAASRLARRGGRLVNADITIICEAPKIGPHRDAMRRRVAEIVGTDIGRISVKATTSEQLGFTGRGEGIAAQAVATVMLPGMGEE